MKKHPTTGVGKGSAKRDMAISQDQFDKNFEKIFGKGKKDDKEHDKSNTGSSLPDGTRSRSKR